ncbi:uncharacterized protein LOC129235929 [Anastrepha obliqua]|uniref:uncharacterized protein LOC129235929 n=1 Tax=Anastrepha obliqua TaxID=95512 RepID=UPI002409E710|nr:uncharacterized protein LOC129235929 [Anastrepha obliqua]XP_054725989.1 uncharacterized protein LOC129235929 [Anastrepha obliqua]
MDLDQFVISMENGSLSNFDESENCRYISHVDYIRKFRDAYKDGTERTFNELKVKVEQDSEDKKQQAGDALTLLSQCRQKLQQLDDQRKCIGKILKEQAEQGNLLFQQIIREEHQLNVEESKMRELLNKVRDQNP